MNAVWNSYGQLCGCPEIFKKSCKFFCRELDIRVTHIMHPDLLCPGVVTTILHLSADPAPIIREDAVCRLYLVKLCQIVFQAVFQHLRVERQSDRVGGSITVGHEAQSADKASECEQSKVIQ